MSFLAPLALLSGLLGGLIVLMYLLKLKRKPEEFSSTLLWMKSMEDLTANAPFQKLRQNLLMYLQIALLILIALSLARPTMWLSRRSGISQHATRVTAQLSPGSEDGRVTAKLSSGSEDGRVTAKPSSGSEDGRPSPSRSLSHASHSNRNAKYPRIGAGRSPQGGSARGRSTGPDTD